ncbi:hypothetical protein PoB_003653000 [Plakobranchus ocellatus]|uniref:Uncharacterized protein n=1 Tax=Plakobranchus ocellatus TaxID=259542 RepID=A0AAV4ARU9_9GAST|nr:hypothetical protein PoB_003653000 [Plakobranchus ocellatus]
MIEYFERCDCLFKVASIDYRCVSIVRGIVHAKSVPEKMMESQLVVGDALVSVRAEIGYKWMMMAYGELNATVYVTTMGLWNGQ